MPVRSPFVIALMIGALSFGAACTTGGDEDAVAETSSTTTAAPDGTDTTASDTTDPDATDPDATDPDTSGDADEEAYVEALTGAMLDPDAGGPPLSEEQAECLAGRFVTIMDVDRLEEQGYTPEELGEIVGVDFSELGLDEDQANAVYDAYGACDFDVEGVLLDGVVQSADLDDEAIACIESAATDDKIRALMVGMIMVGEDEVDDIPEVAAFAAELEACVQ